MSSASWGADQLYRNLRRRLQRDRSWTLLVRPYNDDPFGRAIYAETVGSRGEVPEALDGLARAIRTAGIPVTGPNP
jgi:hypothetical protein